jgi:excinuclease ABC subunit C
MKSELDEIKGVGITRKRQLFKHFGSIEAVKKASIEQLEQVKGLNKVSAKAVYDHFHK